MNNSTTEHDTAKLIIPFHSESTALSIDINISYYQEIPEIGENPLVFVDLTFVKIFPFLQCAQNVKQFISACKLAILNKYKRFCRSMYSC